MASTAAIEGIQVYGLRWRAKLPIKAFIPNCSEINDEHAKTVGRILAKHLAKHETKIGFIIGDAELSFENEFEFEYVQCVEDLIDALNTLYD